MISKYVFWIDMFIYFVVNLLYFLNFLETECDCSTIEISFSFNAKVGLFGGGAEINDGERCCSLYWIDSFERRCAHYYEHACILLCVRLTRPIDRSRELYVHARLARDNSLEFSQRCVAFFSRVNASIAVQTSETRSS